MKPVKILKVFLLILASAFIVSAVAAALFVTFYPVENIVQMVTSKAEAALGRKVTVSGLKYSLRGVTLEGVSLHEGADAGSPVLASVEKAELRPSLLSLMKLEIDFSSILLEKARCNISFDPGGESNIGRLISGISGKKGGGVSAKISKILLDDAFITLSSPPPYLAPLAGTYAVDAAVHLADSVMIDDCTIILPENRGTLIPELTVKTKDDFEISGSVNIQNTSLLWVYRWGTNLTLPYNIVNGDVSNLVITKNGVKGDVNATSTLLNTGKILRADGFCNVDIPGRTVFIGRADGGVERSSFFIESLQFTFDGKLIGFNIKKIDASVQDVAPMLKFMPVKLFGNVRGDLSCARGMYNGNLSLSGCGYDHDLRIVDNLRTDIAINNNMFKKTGIMCNLAGNPCSLSIASTDPSLTTLHVNVTSDKILIDPEKNKFSRSDSPINIPLNVTGIINIRSLEYGQHRLGDIQLQYRLSGSNFDIDGFQFLYAGGKISGEGNIVLAQGPPQASLTLQLSNIMIQNAISFNEKMRNRFFGAASGSSRIRFELSDAILKTAKGNVEFSVDRGKLVDTGVQNGLGLILSELKYKLRDLEFNKIYGNIDIRGTSYQVNSFIFNANNIRLKITGQFDLDLISSPLNIQLEFTKNFIQDIPPAFTFALNKYYRGDWYIIPFIMSGDMTDSKNVKRAD